MLLFYNKKLIKISNINQLEINYKESYIKFTVKLMNKILQNKEKFSITQLMNLIIFLYKLSDLSKRLKLSQEKSHFIIQKKLKLILQMN